MFKPIETINSHVLGGGAPSEPAEQWLATIDIVALEYIEYALYESTDAFMIIATPAIVDAISVAYI